MRLSWNLEAVEGKGFLELKKEEDESESCESRAEEKKMEEEYGRELRQIVDRMKVLGFRFRASNSNGMKFSVTFKEVGGRPDPVVQTADDLDLLKATKFSALKTLDFINRIGTDWKNRPIKEGSEDERTG